MHSQGPIDNPSEKKRVWAHRLAWLLWGTTFPLIWMGGFVTTFDAGMAVPDWPNTYGYNLFLYPIESWLKTWDVFLEHSHRLIAATAGFLSLGLFIILWKTKRSSYRWLGTAVFAMVCLQGIIGGLRVLGQEILLANIHGCVAPLFFGLVTAVVVTTGQPTPITQAATSPAHRAADRFLIIRVATLVAVYCQVVAGAQLRHLPPTAPPSWAFFWTIVHLVLAGTIGVLISIVWVYSRAESGLVRRWVSVATGIYLCQVVLGLLTWVVNYNFPVWFLDYFLALSYTVVKGGAAQAVVTTAHTATGSLLLAAMVLLVIVPSKKQISPAPPCRVLNKHANRRTS